MDLTYDFLLNMEESTSRILTNPLLFQKIILDLPDDDLLAFCNIHRSLLKLANDYSLETMKVAKIEQWFVERKPSGWSYIGYFIRSGMKYYLEFISRGEYTIDRLLKTSSDDTFPLLIICKRYPRLVEYLFRDGKFNRFADVRMALSSRSIAVDLIKEAVYTALDHKFYPVLNFIERMTKHSIGQYLSRYLNQDRKISDPMPILKILFENYAIRPSSADEFTWRGNIEILRYLCKCGTVVENNNMLRKLIVEEQYNLLHAMIEDLEFAITVDLRYLSDEIILKHIGKIGLNITKTFVSCNIKPTQDMVDDAARYGHVELLKYLRDIHLLTPHSSAICDVLLEGAPPRPSLRLTRIAPRTIQTVRYILDNGYEINCKTFNVSLLGDTDLVERLIRRRIFPDAESCIFMMFDQKLYTIGLEAGIKFETEVIDMTPDPSEETFYPQRLLDTAKSVGFDFHRITRV